MARYFFDSSALVKIYHQELGSEKVAELFLQPNRSIIISQLTVVEITSAFARRVRMGEVSVADAISLRNHFLNDVATEALTVVTITNQHFFLAENLLTRYAIVKSLRTLDALQLAVALDVHRRSSLAALLAADRIMTEVALAEGLSVINPEL